MKNNYFNKLSVILGLGVASIALSGCDSFRNTFGLDHYQPDEFKVSDNPPLSMPKDYKLRPPAGSGNGTEGVAPIATAPSGAQAQNLLLGSSAATMPAVKTQNGEQNLLAMASTQQQASPNIRETVNREAAVSTNVSDSMIQRIMSWKEEAARNISSISGETPPSTTANNQSGPQ